MRFRHTSNTLRRLDEDTEFTGGYAPALVKAFRMRMQTIRAALNETDFYAQKSLRYEKLKGKRKHQRSMRLNDQFRLVFEIEERSQGNVIVLVAIEDYH